MRHIVLCKNRDLNILLPFRFRFLNINPSADTWHNSLINFYTSALFSETKIQYQNRKQREQHGPFDNFITFLYLRIFFSELRHSLIDDCVGRKTARNQMNDKTKKEKR